MLDLVGVQEIAARLDVKQQTVSMWQIRDTGFPEPRWTVSGDCGVWVWGTVEKWARKTGRLA